jgi:hypothetical protein
MEKGQKGNMETMIRKPMQGVLNIIRFNWHYYVIAISGIAALLYVSTFLSPLLQILAIVIAFFTILSLLVSLVVSYYVYDRSNLYALNWLPASIPGSSPQMVNIHAGFDETSALLVNKYPGATLKVFDFYDPRLHTEVSIQRARKAYPAYPGTQSITTADVPLPVNAADHIFLILAAHEIRDDAERVHFFEQLRHALRADGRITVVEHLRDINNLLAYNVGGFHFLSRRTWQHTFSKAGLQVESELPLTPFIAVYTLTK